jgi:hypothetical protein
MNEKNLLWLSSELQKHTVELLKAVNFVKNESVSNYPVLVVMEKGLETALGIDLKFVNSELCFSLTTLEELYVKNLMKAEAIDDFRSLYNKKDECFCVLTFLGEKPNFVFVPMFHQT